MLFRALAARACCRFGRNDQRIELSQLLGQHKVAVVQQPCPRREQPDLQLRRRQLALGFVRGERKLREFHRLPVTVKDFEPQQMTRPRIGGKEAIPLIQPRGGNVRFERCGKRLAQVARRRRSIPRRKELRGQVKH